MRGTGRAIVWLGGLAVALIGLRVAGTGELAAPPVSSIDGLGRWVDARDPATAAIALVRFVAELSTWYLLGLSVLHGAGSLLRVRGAHALADTLAVGGTSRVVRAGLGLGLLASTTVGADGFRAAPATPTMERLTVPAAGIVVQQGLDPATATMTPLGPRAEDEGASAWMTPLGDDADPAGVTTGSEVAADVTSATTPTAWQVADGESFWTIATRRPRGPLATASVER